MPEPNPAIFVLSTVFLFFFYENSLLVLYV
nr:MAG TPA: hypothetical protein [Caudoviricetes sp.]